MITGKFSALKGFGLFLYAIITIMALVACCQQGGIFCGVGIVNTLANGWLISSLYKYWSNDNNSVK